MTTARAGTRPGVRAADPPSLTDGFVAVVSQRFGGPLGRHAASGGRWWNPVRVALLVGVVTYVAGMVFRLPCRAGADHFRYLCYSDIPLLYPGRGLMQGNTPYLDSGDYPVLEYPVLTGWFLELERILTRLLGGAQGLDLTAEQQAESTMRFLDVNTVLLGGLFLVAVWAQVRTVAPRPWDGMMLAASPCVAATALINWDMLPVALTALGMMAWSGRRPGLAGILFGLGMAAKLYPLFLLGPLLLLCLRSRRLADYFTLLSTFVVSWGLTNLPALWLAPAAWRSFWSFNAERGGDLGSIWYVFSLADRPVPNLNLVSFGVFGFLCLGIAAIIVVAPRRPRFGAVAFLVVVAFLLTSKVYSPQYVLWLLPFVVLARPRWRDWLVFTAGELIYFVAIWWHLAGALAPGDSSSDRIYWLAVIIRLCTQLWVAALVVRDIFVPSRDPVRAGGLDDPTGGVLDRAPDVGWWLGSRRAPWKSHPDGAQTPPEAPADAVRVSFPGESAETRPRRAL